MKSAARERVLVTAKIENLMDLFDADKGLLPLDQVRRIEVTDALVDPAASMLLLPRKMIADLGLLQSHPRMRRGLDGRPALPIHSAVRLTIQGREGHLDVGEIGDESPVLIGRIPLLLLDWVVDPIGQRLIGNPEHGGIDMIEVF